MSVSRREDQAECPAIQVSEYVQAWSKSPFGTQGAQPWEIIRDAEALVRSLLNSLDADYHIEGDVAVHRTAHVEPGAVLKGPIVLGPKAYTAGSAYLRGGVYLDAGCIVGPGCELKSTLMFAGSKLAHFNFVGDSIVGSSVNIEAGAVIANYRNELVGGLMRIRFDGRVIDLGPGKFGALVGDDVRVGANAVIAPGALLRPETQVGRLQLIDQTARS